MSVERPICPKCGGAQYATNTSYLCHCRGTSSPQVLDEFDRERLPPKCLQVWASMKLTDEEWREWADDLAEYFEKAERATGKKMKVYIVTGERIYTTF